MKGKKKRSKRSWHDRLLIGITALAALTYTVTIFYVDTAEWRLSDLKWQIPTWIGCAIWLLLFAYANNGRFEKTIQRKKARKAAAKEIRKAA